ncbi:cytochrome p450 [Stemphylium lycopersici]|uniref:Cytochrome p450 n=1 Tax=Stemphylium lycopersici TaxID=183478 RepID=A0A364N5X2_STELY|nr:cytochrome p450 [Stemphylium lycopersici]RAR01192.1 cytochrome p450 [Stemphylium lycopersici]RAR12724.1 cytochrome p450 [Stemphylium lycopersici]
MGIFNILEKPIFSSRFKLPIHIAQVVLVSIAVGLSVPRLFIKNVPRTRSGTIALGMGAKSLILLAYLILSEHAPRFRRWHSYKAHAIISCLEVVFWGAVAGLTFQGNVKSCEGVTCGLSWAVFVVAIIINNTELVASGIAIREFREWKLAGKPKGLDLHRHSDAHRRVLDGEEMDSPQVVQPKEMPVQAAQRAYFQPESPQSEHDHYQHQNGRLQRDARYAPQAQAPQYPGHQQYPSTGPRY